MNGGHLPRCKNISAKSYRQASSWVSCHTVSEKQHYPDSKLETDVDSTAWHVLSSLLTFCRSEICYHQLVVLICDLNANKAGSCYLLWLWPPRLRRLTTRKPRKRQRKTTVTLTMKTHKVAAKMLRQQRWTTSTDRIKMLPTVVGRH